MAMLPIACSERASAIFFSFVLIVRLKLAVSFAVSREPLPRVADVATSDE